MDIKIKLKLTIEKPMTKQQKRHQYNEKYYLKNRTALKTYANLGSLTEAEKKEHRLALKRANRKKHADAKRTAAQQDAAYLEDMRVWEFPSFQVRDRAGVDVHIHTDGFLYIGYENYSGEYLIKKVGGCSLWRNGAGENILHPDTSEPLRQFTITNWWRRSDSGTLLVQQHSAGSTVFKEYVMQQCGTLVPNEKLIF
jgi:hypothetical protein